jgi:hypothetical protein
MSDDDGDVSPVVTIRYFAPFETYKN